MKTTIRLRALFDKFWLDITDPSGQIRYVRSLSHSQLFEALNEIETSDHNANIVWEKDATELAARSWAL